MIFSADIGFSLSWTGHIDYHIWYLAYLFIQTMLLLPLFKWLSQKKGMNKQIEFLSNNAFRLGYLLIPVILLEFLLRPLFPDYLNWADFVVYTFYFILGYIFQLKQNFINTVGKNYGLFILIGLLCTLLPILFRASITQSSIPALNWSYLGIIVLKNINTLAWVLAFFGLAKQFLSFNHPLLHDLNQGILPFYILHQTIIILIGFYVVQWSLGILDKFLIIFSLSLIITIALYQLIWRKTILRFLFGMKI